MSKAANYAGATRGTIAPDDTDILWYDTNANTYKYYNSLSEEWEPVDESSIYSVFEQTAEGFNLKGNVNYRRKYCYYKEFKANR